MIKPEKPANEAERIAALHSYDILDTAPEQAFDDLVEIAVAICAAPMGTVSLVDDERQWFKSRLGITTSETSRDITFCAHAILTPQNMLIVADALNDERFRDSPLVSEDPNIRFYAGVPLVASGGEAVGTFCVMDHQPRELSEYQITALQSLSRQAARLLELRRVSRDLNHQLREREWYEQQLQTYQRSLEIRNAKLTEQTHTDALTGLSNRRAFVDALDSAVRVAADAEPLAIAVIDIDHFKSVNDVHGHVEGDRILQAVAEVLKTHGAARGRAARYGGEEFVLLFPETPLDQARLQCEDLRDAIANLPLAVPLTVSIGLAAYERGDSAETLFTRADEALYAAKADGRNRVAVAS